MGQYLRLVYKMGGNFVYFTGIVMGVYFELVLCMGSKNYFTGIVMGVYFELVYVGPYG